MDCPKGARRQVRANGVIGIDVRDCPRSKMRKSITHLGCERPGSMLIGERTHRRWRYRRRASRSDGRGSIWLERYGFRRWRRKPPVCCGYRRRTARSGNGACNNPRGDRGFRCSDRCRRDGCKANQGRKGSVTPIWLRGLDAVLTIWFAGADNPMDQAVECAIYGTVSVAKVGHVINDSVDEMIICF
jgi:hypothetical protein